VIALGYAGWDAGQLEDEMARNAWLTVDADERVLFSTPVEERWSAAARLLGVDLVPSAATRATPDLPDDDDPILAPATGGRPAAGEVILAFDFGRRRIGVAVGQTLTGSANAVGVLPAHDGAPDWAAVDTCIAQWGPGRLLVGLPL